MALGYYRLFTVDHTKVNSGTQTNFPVVISGTYSWAATIANGGRATSSNGFDIRPFSNSALSTAYTYQLRSYNPTTGAFNMVVLIPSLSAAVDTLIYVGIGDSGITTDGSSNGVWDANFKDVWTYGDGASLSLVSWTSTGTVLTNNNAVTATPGLVGGMGAASFNGTTQSLSSTSPSVTADPLTIEAMFNPADQTTSGDIAGLNNATTLTGNRSFLKRVNNGTFNPMRAMQSGASATVNQDQSSSTGAYSASAWNYGAVTCSGTSDTNIHPNGAAKTNSATATGVGSAINRLVMGARMANSLTNNFFTGAIGETRFSNIVRADSWIVTTYNNLIGIASFYSVGSEVPVGSGGKPVTYYQQQMRRAT
jgi:hypothetical protein